MSSCRSSTLKNVTDVMGLLVINRASPKLVTTHQKMLMKTYMLKKKIVKKFSEYIL